MTAWQLLIQNSAAPNGSTAWVHLMNQQGGGSPDVFVFGGGYTTIFGR